MSSRRFIFFFATIFAFGALPFLISQPSAIASAGLNLGFSAPLQHMPVLVMLMTTGLVAALLPRDGLVLMPVAFALMTMLGGMLMLDINYYPGLRYFMLGAILCMGLLIGIAREKLTVMMLLVLASLGFHLGGFYMTGIPAIAAPIYYLLGVLLSLGLGFAIAVAFGVTVIGDHEAAWTKLKQSPRFTLIRSLFL